MERTERFVDIHCHLLPGVDDGPAMVENALDMVRMALDDGIQTIVATPHQLGNHPRVSADAIRQAAVAFQRLLAERGLPLRVLPGAEVRIEPDVVPKCRSGEILTLADRRRHVLLELPHQVYVPLEPLLGELADGGLVGILAHPERNQGILRNPGGLASLVRRGGLLQLTASSLTGAFGGRVQRLSESLVEQGLVHFIGSDAHGTGTRAPRLRQAFQRVKELAGEAAARELCYENAAAVAAGVDVPGGCRKTAKSTWTGWFRRTFSSEHAAAAPI